MLRKTPCTEVCVVEQWRGITVCEGRLASYKQQMSMNVHYYEYNGTFCNNYHSILYSIPSKFLQWYSQFYLCLYALSQVIIPAYLIYNITHFLPPSKTVYFFAHKFSLILPGHIHMTSHIGAWWPGLPLTHHAIFSLQLLQQTCATQDKKSPSLGKYPTHNLKVRNRKSLYMTFHSWNSEYKNGC